MEVAHQTSGSIAVSDEEALRFAEFAAHYHSALDPPGATSQASLDSIRAFLGGKRPGQVGLRLWCLHLPIICRR